VVNAKPLSLPELGIVTAGALLLAVVLCCQPAFAVVETTAIAGKVLMPDGTAVTSGTITAALAAPGSVDDLTTGEGERVGGLYRGTIAASGVTLSLVPNDAITPAGTYYVVTYSVLAPTRTSWTERWSVTSAPDPIDIGDIARLQVAPGLSLPQATTRTSVYYRAHQEGSITGRLYVPGALGAGNLGATSFPVNTMRAVPFLQGRTRTVDRLAFSVSVEGNVGSQARACLYANKSETDPYPGALLASSSCSAGISSTGVKTCAVSAQLAGDGLYWATFNHGDTVGAPLFSSVTSTGAEMFFGFSSSFVADGTALSVSQSFGAACPDPFPAGAIAVAEAPAIGIRYSN
jgi:hypothetical protein